MPDEEGYADLEGFKAALSRQTAGIFITNPEDTGIYNPRIDEFVKAAHAVGSLCYYDQANANGMLGIARAREAGFDMCHFNLHKTFSIPHGSMGGAVGALGCREALAKFLPVPQVKFDGENYYLDYDCPESIGKVRSFLGNVPSLQGLFLDYAAWRRRPKRSCRMFRSQQQLHVKETKRNPRSGCPLRSWQTAIGAGSIQLGKT
jgi:glycine cleavage system protein P-like pyridoxal-binding family